MYANLNGRDYVDALIADMGQDAFTTWFMRGRAEAMQMLSKYAQGGTDFKPESLPTEGTPLSDQAWYQTYATAWNSQITIAYLPAL